VLAGSRSRWNTCESPRTRHYGKLSWGEIEFSREPLDPLFVDVQAAAKVSHLKVFKIPFRAFYGFSLISNVSIMIWAGPLTNNEQDQAASHLG
jgi:hypothetical protein